jgi:hypothetical protein
MAGCHDTAAREDRAFMRQFRSHASGPPGDCLKRMADIDIDHPRIAVVTGGSSGIGRHTAMGSHSAEPASW